MERKLAPKISGQNKLLALEKFDTEYQRIFGNIILSWFPFYFICRFFSGGCNIDKGFPNRVQCVSNKCVTDEGINDEEIFEIESNDIVTTQGAPQLWWEWSVLQETQIFSASLHKYCQA